MSNNQSNSTSNFVFSSDEEHIQSEDDNTRADLDNNQQDLGQKVLPKKRVKRSGIWSHFSNEDNKCVHCNLSLASTEKGSTSNLWRHLKLCHVELYNKEMPQMSTKFSQGIFEDSLTKWIVVDDQPFTTIENPGFKEMINTLNPNAKLYSADKLKSDIEKRFIVEKGKIIKILESSMSKLSYTIDLWTSPNGYSILGITVHFLDVNWEKRNYILSFKQLEGAHSGENICKAFVDVLKEYRILFSKIMGITCDNVTSNNTFMEALMLENDSITDDTRIRCFPHIINLSVQEFFKALKSTNHSNLDDNNKMDDTIVQEIRAIVKYVRDSPQREQKFFKICKNEDLPELHLIIDVKTRWNSTYEMIKRALILKKGINSFLISERKNDMIVSEKDWDNVEILLKVLEKFNVATKVSSGSLYPSISSTLALKIWLNKTLMNYKNDYQFLDEAITKSLEKIEEYSGIFEQSDI